MKLVRKGGGIYLDNVVREVLKGGYEVTKKETLLERAGKVIGQGEKIQATVVSMVSAPQEKAACSPWKHQTTLSMQQTSKQESSHPPGPVRCSGTSNVHRVSKS